MLRLLIVLVVIGLAVYFTLFQGTGGDEPAMESYRNQMEEAEQLEQQLQDSARERLQRVEEKEGR